MNVLLFDDITSVDSSSQLILPVPGDEQSLTTGSEGTNRL